MAYSPQVWINDETDVDEEHMMHIEEGIKNSYNISLLAVSASAPSECDEGDKYYNTITKKIYVATGTNTWSAEGTTPLKDILYILFSNNTAYAWNDEDLVSVGGGSINVNNSTITIKKNNVTVDSFTTNASSDKSINIPIPTKTSELNNDSSFTTLNQANGYSSAEAIVGKWINGKPIYRKVYTLTKTTAKTSWTDFADLPANIDQITCFYGVIKESSGNMKPVPYYEGSSYYEGLLARPSTGKLQYMSTYANSTSYITIEYTKTTD